MSEKNFSQKDSLRESSLSSINWISLWQASGNDWSWMVKQGCLSNSRSSVTKKDSFNQKKVILLELFLTIALLLLARYIESSHSYIFKETQKTNFFESSIIQFDSQPKYSPFFEEKK